MLDDRMTRSYTSLTERQTLEPDTSLVKTYVLDAHLLKSDTHTSARQLPRRLFSTSQRLPPTRVRETDATTLFTLDSKIRPQPVTAFPDFTNPRYWLLHSMSGSSAMDWFVDRFVTNTPDLDRVWLPAMLLEQIAGLGSLRGLGLDYDRRAVPDVDFQDTSTSVEFLKMQLWGNRAREVLRLLRETAAFPHGKITARGTSFQSHLTLVSLVTEEYGSRIRNLERDFALGSMTHEGRVELTGEPINFLFDRSTSKTSAR